ncbi:hypothetical protein H4O18_16465 [Arenibacter sp. BSSL-BM3]|uniref:RiboL-PSP-HEPN domain-containing protein n=1 Tax=Arenibacter arenosicollis TaxID=2762274 RepID=A0ABR7QQY3_9FLAO|nr:DUF5677 domain-containing protein [Arenibacter arenosicollis]MBC8769593.1 hypothetical protein [Arenibacter arenosicollis]
MNSKNEINNELNKIILGIEEEISSLIKKNETDYFLFALRGLVRYTSTLFKRLTTEQNIPIEYLAFSARSLFECYLLVEFIIKDPSKAKDFISQKPKEELEINKGFLSLKTENASETAIKMIHDRIDYIEKLTKDYVLTPTRHWSVSHLALETNNKLEYDAFFKLYSKYVHPSSWIMNSHEYEHNNPVFRNIFLSQGQINANRIVKSIKKYKNK